MMMFAVKKNRDNHYQPPCSVSLEDTRRGRGLRERGASGVEFQGKNLGCGKDRGVSGADREGPRCWPGGDRWGQRTGVKGPDFCRH